MNLQQDLLGLLGFRPVRLAALMILIVGIGSACFVTKYSVRDPDVWWHLAVGQWIVQHHAVPHTGILSRTTADSPWMAYSWAYELLLSRSYAWFGFLGVGLYGTAVTTAVTVAIFWMAWRLSGRFWLAWFLTISASFAFLFNIMPRPLFVTMTLFAITLTLLLEANRTGSARSLYWLPLVFFVWANCHVQFINGLLALGLFAGVNATQRLAITLQTYPDSLALPTLPLRTIFIVLACAVAATCLGPYTFHVYGAVFGYASSKIIYSLLVEMQALTFLGPSHFVELFLAAGAFLALGWRKKLEPFQLLLLTTGSLLAFHMARDAWFLCITAVAAIADSMRPVEQRDSRFNLRELAGVGLAAFVLLFLVARNTGFDPRGLDRTITSEYPVDAVNYVRTHPVPGPLYNNFNWGGFLIFYMPQYPVVIDGRTDLYGDDLVSHFYAIETADPSYETDPRLNDSGVVLLMNKLGLAQILPLDPRFRVIYRDEIATVFAHN